MKTEVLQNNSVRGWIFYDAACPVCQRGVRLIGRLFARRGYEWQPLQTPGVARRLGVSEGALLQEMKLQFSDGRVVGGIDSWIALFRSVWWLRPLGLALTLPGFHALGQWCYRWIARHRYCVGGKCSLQREDGHRRTIPFLDLP